MKPLTTWKRDLVAAALWVGLTWVCAAVYKYFPLGVP